MHVWVPPNLSGTRAPGCVRTAFSAKILRFPIWICFRRWENWVRLGFLDGRAGFAYSRMRTCYEMFIDLKVLEAERRRDGAPV